MGGKTKHQQRTKNNTKPSSSGRSAELLASSTMPTTVGFANVTQFGFLPTMLQDFTVSDNATIDEMDSTLDTNYQLVFRKMTKKDPITKVKALQEFTELVLKTETATIKSVLPFWPRLYNNLSTDVEHRVREATQQAQSALMNQAGKSFAPYLKQIAPAWITSQYDTYAPAASVASQSFQKSFPAHKLQDVFNFCQNEILDYITKNLTVYTATTLSNPQSNTPEECEAKYQRVLVCSLKGYALYLSKMLPEHLKEASNKNMALLENGKFWAYHKHKNANIRAAWFEALSALLQSTPELLANFEKQTVSAAMQNLDESETVVLPHVWSAILLVTQKISKWHTHINMEKALLPKLWKILKNGGGGNAATIYPHLLPLLSKLNREILVDKILPFYCNFFEHINFGLCSRVQHQASSRADITAIATAFYECIQYVLIQLQSMPADCLETETNLTEFSLNFLQLHVIDVIGFLLGNSHSNNGKYVLMRLVCLVQFWSQTSTENKLYQSLLAHFWSNLFTVIEKSFAKTTDDRETIAKLDLVHEIVQYLRTQSSNVLKTKSAKVKFNISDETNTDEVDNIAANKPNTSPIHFETELNDLVVNVCKLYIKRTSETTEDVYIRSLELLLKQFGGSIEFFKQLSGSTSDIAKLYDKFASWLLIKQLRSENVLDMILMLYPNLDATEKSKLLNKLIKFPNEMVQNWMLSRMLSHPLYTEADIVRLLSQPIVTELLMKNARKLTAGNVTDTINLLHKCFFQTENGDILIDCKTCEGIVNILCEPLTDASAVDEHILDTCVSFLAQIMPVICSDERKQTLRNDMFVKLFGVCVDKDRSIHLAEGTLWEAVTAWQDALSSNDIQLDDDLLEMCSTIVNENLRLAVYDHETSVDNVESISELVSKLILCSIERFEDDDESKYKNADKIIENIFGKCSESYGKHLTNVLRSCTFVQMLNGQMTSTAVTNNHLDMDLCTLNSYDNACALLKLAIYKFRVIFKITCNVPQNRNKSESEALSHGVEVEDGQTTKAGEDEHTEDFCDLNETLLKRWSEMIYEEILSGIYAANLFNSFLDNFVLPAHLETFILHLQEAINLLLRHISNEHALVIWERLFNGHRLNDPFWAASTLSLQQIEPYKDRENGLALLHNDLTKATNGTENLIQFVNVLLTFTPKLAARQLSIQANIFDGSIELHQKAIGLRCLMSNYFQEDSNEIGDQEIVNECLKLIDELYGQSKTNKEFLLYNGYNGNLSTVDADKILQTTEFVRFVTDVIKTFAGNITENGWDFIRIAISSWVLSLSKSSDNWKNPKIGVFIASVYVMFKVFYESINAERIKSSTKTMTQVIDEWEHVFAKDVNLILLKCFMKIVQSHVSGIDNREEYFLKTLSECIDKVDFKHVQVAHKIDSKTSIDDLIQFGLQNLSHPYHTVRVACATIIKRMSFYLIEKDVELLIRRPDQDKQTADTSSGSGEWHLLHKFQRILASQNEWTAQYIEEFNFKSTELDDFSAIPATKSIPFMLLWDCVLTICDQAPSEIRSIYAAYLVEQKFEQTLLSMLFRMMPLDVLRNQELKTMGAAYFATVPWQSIANNEITPERYACYVYTLTLKHLPAVVRKWWTNSHPRQKLLVDKITTAFVSTQLCNDELRALLDKKEKHDSFQISVHTSTREVHATYVIDEARMELVIQLPLNYPLGVVKVSCGQQIGDKLQSRVVVMQLSIFLTHQNGSIWDGLSLWKRNLDRKFDGVEECYVCYSVIHQETCQLPKLTCKTCKKKFHGQCLYKWFSTSNKSTCPICRNIF